MSKYSKDVDNKELFSVLNKAIESDKLYWIRNDAKIRASYTSKNYDEFREAVAAAHLNPLGRHDVNKRNSNWNSVAQYCDNDE